MQPHIELKGFKEFQAAITRSPRTVLDQTRKFLVRGLAEYNKGIIRNPWRIGGIGGGVPVSNDPRYPRGHQKQKSGNLRDTHFRKVEGLRGIIGPDIRRAPYASYVHDGTPGGQMRGRPWLDHVKRTKDGAIQKLYQKLLDNITKDLAK